MIAAAMALDEEGQQTARALQGRAEDVTATGRLLDTPGAEAAGMSSVPQEARA
jgi:hypothetical protein